MIFKTSLDGLAKIITVAVTILFSVVIITQFQNISSWKLALAGMMIGIYALCFLFRPLHYRLTADQIIIHSLVYDWIIERNDIKSIRDVSRKMLGPSIRVFGVGGLFGYYGFFSNMELGNFRMLATRRDNGVLIETHNGKKWVITPDDQMGFVTEYSADRA